MVGSTVRVIPVEFLSDAEAAAYGHYGASVAQADLELFFYLDDGDHQLISAAKLRGDHNLLGFSLQFTSVRFIGRFLADPLEGVPTEVIDYLAGQLGIADPSAIKRYAQREPTRREHAGKIQKALKLKDFGQVEVELTQYVGRRAWVTGDGPKAIFADAVAARARRATARRLTAGQAGGPRTRGRDQAIMGNAARGPVRAAAARAGRAVEGGAGKAAVGGSSPFEARAWQSRPGRS